MRTQTGRGLPVSVLAVSMPAARAAQPVVTTPRTYQGGGVGAAVGAGAGALRLLREQIRDVC
jgi:hypothetical protein